jgi:hypothetical protein
MKRVVLCLLWLNCNMPVWSQTQEVPVEPVSIEDYQRIEAARSREGASFDAQEAACYQRFAVNDCLKKVQTKRIFVMADLKSQETRLHDRARNQQGAEALARMEQKALERQQKQKEIETQDGVVRTQEKLHDQHEKRAEHAAKAASNPAPFSVPVPAGPTAVEQAQARANYERKLADAEKRRQDLIKRKAEKASAPAKPLPVPP